LKERESCAMKNELWFCRSSPYDAAIGIWRIYRLRLYGLMDLNGEVGAWR
jgi:hypothetical protein